MPLRCEKHVRAVPIGRSGYGAGSVPAAGPPAAARARRAARSFACVLQGGVKMRAGGGSQELAAGSKTVVDSSCQDCKCVEESETLWILQGTIVSLDTHFYDSQAMSGQRGGTSARMRPVRSSCRRRRCFSSCACQRWNAESACLLAVCQVARRPLQYADKLCSILRAQPSTAV